MKTVGISQVDVLFLTGIYPIEFLFYYKKEFSTKGLRNALRRLSSVFWPAFGEYKDGQIQFDKYREDDFYGEEAAEAEFNIEEIGANGSDAYSRFSLPDLRTLFFLKAIRFKNGLVLIPKINHLAGDGYSYFYFLSLLAALAQPARIPLKSFLTKWLYRPHHRRTILKDFAFHGVDLKPAPQNEKFAVELDEIARGEVRSVINDASTSDNLRISSNDVLSAISLKKLVSRQPEFWGERVSLTIPIDVRPQVKEYGPKFFGNGIMLHTAELKKEEVLNSPTKELAIKIRAAMPSVSRESYISYLTRLEGVISEGNIDELRPFDPERGCLVTNLSKLPADKLNFGTGGPDLALPLTTGKNSTGILAKKDNYILRYSY